MLLYLGLLIPIYGTDKMSAEEFLAWVNRVLKHCCRVSTRVSVHLIMNSK